MAPERTSTMRVVHITEASSGGVWQHLCWVVPEQRRRGIDVDVVVSPLRRDSSFREALASFRDMGCGIDILPMRRLPHPLRDRAATRHLRRLLADRPVSLVHAHAAKAGLVARWAARAMPELRVVYSPHAFPCQGAACALVRSAAVGLERLLSRRTARYVFVSAAEQELAAKVYGIRPERGCVVENGLPADFLPRLLPREAARRSLQIPAQDVAVGVPGRLAAQKGHAWLLQALAADRGPASPFRVHCFGAGPEEARLRHLCSRLALNERVLWHGHVASLRRYLKAFDVIVLPSLYEGLSYLFLESLAAGVPLVVSDIPSHFPRDEIREHVRAVPLQDAQALSRGIRETLDHCEERRRDAADWGPAFVAQHFSLDRQVTELLACYRELG